MVNSQNNRWFALSPKDVLTGMKTKHPVHIMVFGVFTSDGDMSLIFPHGLTLNKKADIKCLEEVALAWVERVAAERPNIWW